ncbi:MAG: hypothetical protein PWP28_183 [Oceanotoga sp.]|jgi:hypothetical protein|nr:hypothetical protein [Oceanotoga sp.]
MRDDSLLQKVENKVYKSKTKVNIFTYITNKEV